MQELIVRIKSLLGRALVREKAEKPNFLEIGCYRLDPTNQQLIFGSEQTELSHRETEILKKLCENREKVVHTQDILLDLWGDDNFFNSRSLHVFITKIRHKLAKDPHIRIINVRGIGYKLIVHTTT